MENRRKNLFDLVAYFCFLSSIIFSFSCSSGEESESSKILKSEKDDNSIINLLAHPQIYVGRTITVSGQIEASEVRKVSKHLTLMTVKLKSMTSPENIKTYTKRSKYDFIDKLREAEDLIAINSYKDIRLLSSAAPKLYSHACDLKIASSRLEALSHYYSGLGKADISASMKQISLGFSNLGDSFISFQKASLASSPEVEKSIPEEARKKLLKFEESLLRASGLMQVFANELEKMRDIISLGYYTFNAEKKLNSQRSHEILTYGSLLKAEAWKQQKSGDDEFYNVATILSKAVQDFGGGDKQVNLGLVSLAATLNKTAVSSSSDSMDSLRCAYIGFNNSHLSRCLNTLNRLDENVEIKITGELRRSNLREEVDVLWLHASALEVDGVKVALNYGDDGGTMRGAMDLYEWAEAVEKGE